MSGVELRGEGAAFALQTLAREQIKMKLLADINVDLMVCQIEGWDGRVFLRDLHSLLSGFDPCEVR